MRSDSVMKGTSQAPHRSLFNALGFTEEERNRPLIGIVSSYNEIVPGHMNLDKIAEAVKLGVAMAGGTPGNRRLRRYRHGTYRHEIQPGYQGPDCRQHRMYGNGTRI